MHDKFLRLISSPWLTLVGGLALLVTSLWETIESLSDASVGAHHGVLLFSIVQVLKVLPDLLDGIRDAHEGLAEVTGEDKQGEPEGDGERGPAAEVSARGDLKTASTSPDP